MGCGSCAIVNRRTAFVACLVLLEVIYLSIVCYVIIQAPWQYQVAVAKVAVSKAFFVRALTALEESLVGSLHRIDPMLMIWHSI